jgi:hypothetical protein
LARIVAHDLFKQICGIIFRNSEGGIIAAKYDQTRIVVFLISMKGKLRNDVKFFGGKFLGDNIRQAPKIYFVGSRIYGV